jgi:hypothetical protein
MIYKNRSQFIVMKYMIMVGSGFSTEIYEWVWFSKILNTKRGGHVLVDRYLSTYAVNIKSFLLFCEWGCFENLSGTSVPKSRPYRKSPPPPPLPGI